MTLPDRYRTLRLRRFAEDFRDAVEIAEVPLEPPAPGQLLVRNRHAGVNGLFDRSLSRGMVAYRHLVPPFDLGVEAVGEVAAVGGGVTGFAVGDAVSVVRLGGAYREYQLVEAASAIPLPAVDPAYVALIPTGISAVVVLREVAQPRAGESVVVSAAAGGLGQFLVQLLKRAGCRVAGTCGGPEKAELLRGLGCDRVIDHRAEDVAAALKDFAPGGINLAIDTVGGAIFDTFLEAVAPRGRLVVSGAAHDLGLAEPELRPRVNTAIYWKAASIRAFQNALYPEAQASARAEVLSLHAAGGLKVHLDGSGFTGVESIPDAVEHLLSGRSSGKVHVSF
ncbi:MAG TPA: zinc-binding dehydrogenase [Azospirillaceae bacterium]|nr:zinc-binding dehydrogenase [Azospirillaceae bacterium]